MNIYFWIIFHLMKLNSNSLVETFFFIVYENMAHSYVGVRKDVHHVNTLWIFLSLCFRYYMCFLKVHSWIKFYLFSISICVMLRQSTTQSRASTITSLFLLVVSITSEKTLLHFCLIPMFPSVIGVIESFYVVRCDHFFLLVVNTKFDGLISWWRCFKMMSTFQNVIHVYPFIRIEIVALLSHVCSFTI